MEQTSHSDNSKYSALDKLGDACRSQCYIYSRKKEMPYNTSIIPLFSIIIPTYNESKNILELIQAIRSCIGDRFSTEVIVMDDNSPDKTGRLVERYADNLYNQKIYQQEQQHSSKSLDVQQIFLVRVIRRESKQGLVSALLEGIKNLPWQVYSRIRC